MLKAQLHSKIHQLVSISSKGTDWMDIEDILTGDFFGTLDYLPRIPFLKDFIDYVVSLNPQIELPSNEDVDWNNVRVLFWPRTFTHKENAEPDVVIISNNWVLVIEVKLLSGLHDSQPWREYVVGQKIAEEYAISPDSVYYLVVARDRLNIAHAFKRDQNTQLKELSSKTLYLKWHEAVSLLDSWLRRKDITGTIPSNVYRLISDLYLAVRRRRVLAFSGYAFENTGLINLVKRQIFCPPRFSGFLRSSYSPISRSNFVFFFQSFNGFGSYFVAVSLPNSFLFCDKTFKGFISTNVKGYFEYDFLFLPLSFSGFLRSAPSCNQYKFIFLKGA